MRPNILRSRDGIQLSFDLPFRISDACIYPRKPANGSQVIICAHNEGIRVIWYAGKKLKESATSNVNGHSTDLTDQDEDDNPPIYEEEEREIDPLRPFHEVLGYKDIRLDSAATKLAVPPHSLGRNDDFHPVFNTHGFVAVGCADLSIRIIRISLQLDKQEHEKAQQIIISGNNTHQDLISDIAITITANLLNDEDARTRSRVSGLDGRESIESPKEWSILLASTSSTGTGLLLTHQIPIITDGRLSGSFDDCIPIQRRLLRCSLVRCHLEFNPSLYPSHRHSHLLIASGDGTATKVYQTLPGLTFVKKYRGSTATIDSVTSANEASRRSALADRVLIDLHSPFHRLEDTTALLVRKSVLDAKWVLHGRGIIALLEDGDWGVWDLEAAGPSTSTSTSNLVKSQSDISGIQGGSVSKFAIQGSVITSTSGKRRTSGNSRPAATASSLAPMTPHTRKKRSEDLFKGKDQELSSRPVTNEKISGSISVLVQPDKMISRSQDESVVLRYGSGSTLIASLQAFWRSDGTGAGSFDGSDAAKLMPLPQVRLAGEQPESIHLIPTLKKEIASSPFATNKVPQDFLVATSSRLILFVSPLAEPSIQSHATSLSARLLAGPSVNQDQMLLDSGELDVDGMERILDNMANSGTIAENVSLVPFNGIARKSVGFRFDNDDEDTNMDSPTTSKSSRSKLTVNNQQQKQQNAKRLFA